MKYVINIGRGRDILFINLKINLYFKLIKKRIHIWTKIISTINIDPKPMPTMKIKNTTFPLIN